MIDLEKPLRDIENEIENLEDVMKGYKPILLKKEEREISFRSVNPCQKIKLGSW